MAGTITASTRSSIVRALVSGTAGANAPWLGVGVASGTASATDVALFEEVQALLVVMLVKLLQPLVEIPTNG